LNQDQDLIAALATVIFGASLGFLIWNKNPAKIYMGDAGSLFLGALIAILTIRFEPKTGYQITSLATPIFLLAVPILDTTVAVTSRIRRGVSPFTGGQDHLSHRLIKMGFNRRAAVLTLWSITAIFCFFAFAISAASKIYEIPLMLMGIVIWILLFILFTGISFTWQSSEN
jgi:UDP-GlcNAc:undecaprenyl-phosphate GlcNAc-1-phosphate transferase